MSKKATFLNSFFCTLIFTSFLGSFFSCSNKSPFGEGNYLTSDNVKDTIWLKNTFPESFSNYIVLDTSIISIRVSRKKVMQGFLNSGDTSNGAFTKLLDVFSGFNNTLHNPNGKSEYFFFDGGDSGRLSKPIVRSEYFKLTEYSSNENNLHYQFWQIAKEIKKDTLQKKFFVIFSDGETTIREEQNLNKDELTILKENTKEILQTNPNIQIGVLSLIANFNGDYVYDLNKFEKIKCKRYLYAICFFDRKFLPEFDRFCELNINGNNFLFNPQFTINTFTPEYLTDKIDGQSNIAMTNYYAAFPMAMDGKDFDFDFKNRVTLKNISIPKQIKRESYKYIQTDTLTFGNPILIDSGNTELSQHQKIKITNLKSSCIIKIDFKLYFNQKLQSFISGNILDQDILNNTIENVKNINEDQILKTEGLRDVFQKILEALQETKQNVALSNFIQLGKFD